MKTHEWIAVPDGTEEFILDKIREDRYEQHQLDLVKRFIKSWHRVLEGGSGLGIVTQALTERAEQVISFEAHIEMHKCAEQNAPDAVVFWGALAMSKASRSPHTGEAFGVGQPPSAPTITPMKIDSVVRKWSINTLVLDVEGEEADILFNIDLEPIELIIVETHEELAGKGKLAGVHARLLVEGFTVLASKADGSLRHLAYSR